MNLLLRLPASLHTALRELAQEDERSLNNLIVRLLRRSVDAAKSPDDPPPPG